MSIQLQRDKYIILNGVKTKIDPAKTQNDAPPPGAYFFEVGKNG